MNKQNVKLYGNTTKYTQEQLLTFIKNILKSIRSLQNVSYLDQLSQFYFLLHSFIYAYFM